MLSSMVKEHQSKQMVRKEIQGICNLLSSQGKRPFHIVIMAQFSVAVFTVLPVLRDSERLKSYVIANYEREFL